MSNSPELIKVKANAVMSPFNITTGHLLATNDQLRFEGDDGMAFIEIKWPAITKVSVQVIFGFYWRGIYVDTAQGEFQFLTTNTKKMVREISQHISRTRIVRRKQIWEKKND